MPQQHHKDIAATAKNVKREADFVNIAISLALLCLIGFHVSDWIQYSTVQYLYDTTYNIVPSILYTVRVLLLLTLAYYFRRTVC